jgi:ABC-2 type transport system permease protein
MDVFTEKLRGWRPAHLEDAGQSVRNIICVATIADVGEDHREGQIARTVYDYLQDNFNRDQLRHALAWVALYPGDGNVITSAPELGLRHTFDPDLIRDRSALYARKYLGRVLGKIRD